MCVGGDSGDASLLELSNSLVTCTKAEKVDVVGDVDHDAHRSGAEIKYQQKNDY